MSTYNATTANEDPISTELKGDSQHDPHLTSNQISDKDIKQDLMALNHEFDKYGSARRSLDALQIAQPDKDHLPKERATVQKKLSTLYKPKNMKTRVKKGSMNSDLKIQDISFSQEQISAKSPNVVKEKDSEEEDGSMKADGTKHSQINKNVSGNITFQLFNNSGEEEVERQVDSGAYIQVDIQQAPEPNSSQPAESPLRSNALTEARKESRLSGEMKDDDIDGLIMASIASRDQPLEQNDEDSMIMQIMDPQSKLSLNEKRDDNGITTSLSVQRKKENQSQMGRQGAADRVKIVKHTLRANVHKVNKNGYKEKMLAEVYSPTVKNFEDHNLSFSKAMVHYVPRPAKVQQLSALQSRLTMSPPLVQAPNPSKIVEKQEKHYQVVMPTQYNTKAALSIQSKRDKEKKKLKPPQRYNRLKFSRELQESSINSANRSQEQSIFEELNIKKMKIKKLELGQISKEVKDSIKNEPQIRSSVRSRNVKSQGSKDNEYSITSQRKNQEMKNGHIKQIYSHKVNVNFQKTKNEGAAAAVAPEDFDQTISPPQSAVFNHRVKKRKIQNSPIKTRLQIRQESSIGMQTQKSQMSTIRVENRKGLVVSQAQIQSEVPLEVDECLPNVKGDHTKVRSSYDSKGSSAAAEMETFCGGKDTIPSPRGDIQNVRFQEVNQSVCSGSSHQNQAPLIVNTQMKNSFHGNSKRTRGSNIRNSNNGYGAMHSSHVSDDQILSSEINIEQPSTFNSNNPSTQEQSTKQQKLLLEPLKLNYTTKQNYYLKQLNTQNDQTVVLSHPYDLSHTVNAQKSFLTQNKMKFMQRIYPQKNVLVRNSRVNNQTVDVDYQANDENNKGLMIVKNQINEQKQDKKRNARLKDIKYPMGVAHKSRSSNYHNSNYYNQQKRNSMNQDSIQKSSLDSNPLTEFKRYSQHVNKQITKPPGSSHAPVRMPPANQKVDRPSKSQHNTRRAKRLVSLNNSIDTGPFLRDHVPNFGNVFASTNQSNQFSTQISRDMFNIHVQKKLIVKSQRSSDYQNKLDSDRGPQEVTTALIRKEGNERLDSNGNLDSLGSGRAKDFNRNQVAKVQQLLFDDTISPFAQRGDTTERMRDDITNHRMGDEAMSPGSRITASSHAHGAKQVKISFNFEKSKTLLRQKLIDNPSKTQGINSINGEKQTTSNNDASPSEFDQEKDILMPIAKVNVIQNNKEDQISKNTRQIAYSSLGHDSAGQSIRFASNIVQRNPQKSYISSSKGLVKATLSQNPSDIASPRVLESILSPQEYIKKLQERSKERLEQLEKAPQENERQPKMKTYVPKLLKNNESEAFNSIQKYIITKQMRQRHRLKSDKSPSGVDGEAMKSRFNERLAVNGRIQIPPTSSRASEQQKANKSRNPGQRRTTAIDVAEVDEHIKNLKSQASTARMRGAIHQSGEQWQDIHKQGTLLINSQASNEDLPADPYLDQEHPGRPQQVIGITKILKAGIQGNTMMINNDQEGENGGTDTQLNSEAIWNKDTKDYSPCFAPEEKTIITGFQFKPLLLQEMQFQDIPDASRSFGGTPERASSPERNVRLRIMDAKKLFGQARHAKIKKEFALEPKHYNDKEKQIMQPSTKEFIRQRTLYKMQLDLWKRYDEEWEIFKDESDFIKAKPPIPPNVQVLHLHLFLKEIAKTISAVKFPLDFENNYKLLLNTFKEAKRRLQISSIRIIDTCILVEMKETLQSSFDTLIENLTDPFENMIEEARSSRHEEYAATPTRSAQNVKDQPNKFVIQAFAKTNYLSSVSSKFVKSAELC